MQECRSSFNTLTCETGALTDENVAPLRSPAVKVSKVTQSRHGQGLSASHAEREGTDIERLQRATTGPLPRSSKRR